MLFYSQRWDNSYQLANSPSRSLISNIRTTFVFIFTPKYIHDKNYFNWVWILILELFCFIMKISLTWRLNPLYLDLVRSRKTINNPFMKNKSKSLIFADWTNLRASFLQNTESCSQFGALQWKKILCGRDCKVQMQVSVMLLHWTLYCHAPGGQVWVYDVGVSSLLVPGWRILGAQVVTSLMSQVLFRFF